jgi:cytochrome c-type biogenesis protein CcmH/NrfF
MSNRLILGFSLSSLVFITACSELQDNIVAPMPAKVTYVEHIQPLLERSCVRCHNDSITNGTVNLSTYQEVTSRLQAGNPNSSFLTRVISPGGKMYRFLNDPADYDLFYQWIVVDSLAEFP